MGTITKNLLSIHLLSSHKTIQRQKNCVETWLNGFNDYIFTTDIIEGNYNQISHTQDSNYPYSCNVKQLEEMNRIIQNKLYEKFEWFFFGDDDLVMNIDKVLELLQNEKLLIDRICKEDEDNRKYRSYISPNYFNLNLKYAVLGNWAISAGTVYPSGGAGFFIHGDVFKNCKPIKISHPARKYVDILVGEWMKENNIPMIWIGGMTGSDPSEAGFDPKNLDHYEGIQKYITFHRISDFERMKLFNDIWKNKI